MLLSNILITDPAAGPITGLPAVLEENVAAMRALHPALEYRLFQEPDVIALIEQHFDKSVLDAYLQLRPFAFRADIARYCILFHFGGLYVDLSYLLVSPIPTDERMVVFRGNPISAPWDTSNAIIYAPPRHKALECALGMACANVRRRYYGLTSLCPTGPALFGKALATTCEAEDLVTGGARLIRPNMARQYFPGVELPEDDFHHAQMIQATPVAIKRKPMLSPGLSGFGLVGSSRVDLQACKLEYSIVSPK